MWPSSDTWAAMLITVRSLLARLLTERFVRPCTWFYERCHGTCGHPLTPGQLCEWSSVPELSCNGSLMDVFCFALACAAVGHVLVDCCLSSHPYHARVQVAENHDWMIISPSATVML